MYEYRAVIDRVVDGDTVDVMIDLGFDVWTKQRVRVAGIDTPESRTRNLREKKFGKLAAARVEELIPVDSSHIIRTTLDDRGKFGRVLADFPNIGTGTSLSITLINEHLAVGYEGQSKNAVRAAHEANWDYLEEQDNGN